MPSNEEDAEGAVGNVTLLPYCHVTLWPYCHVTLLPYCHVTLLPYRNARVRRAVRRVCAATFLGRRRGVGCKRYLLQRLPKVLLILGLVLLEVLLRLAEPSARDLDPVRLFLR